MLSKKNYIILLFPLLALIGCSKDYSNIEEFLGTELKNVGINSVVKIGNIEEILKIDISFLKPYKSVDSEQQDVLISYLIYKMYDFFNEYENIEFVYYLDKEEEQNTRVVKYNKDKVNKVYTFYNEHNRFLKMVEYCLKEFNKGDVASLNVDFQFINEKFPEITTNEAFFKSLKSFYLESEEGNMGESSNKLILVYFFKKDVLKSASGAYKKDAKKVVKLLSDLWNIAKQKNIEDEEGRLSEILLEAQKGYELNKK